MTMMDAVKRVFEHYADFSGRSSRSEYWYFVLFQVIVIWGAALAIALVTVLERSVLHGSGWFSGYLWICYVLWMAGSVVPELAVEWRRFHDVGMSGALFFLLFVPGGGGIVHLVFTVLPGTAGSNQYGPDPRQASGERESAYR